MKTSNFDGTEFTFNENLNFKPNLNDNSSQLQISHENSNYLKEEKKKELDETEKNIIYSLLTGNDKYKNNNNNINNKNENNINNKIKKEINNKVKINTDEDDKNEYLKNINNQNINYNNDHTSSKKNNNITSGL